MDKISVRVLYGWSELHTGFEPRISEDGSVELVGMGGRTDYDRDGNRVSSTYEPTGIVLSYGK